MRVYRLPHGTGFWSEEWPEHSALERLWRKFLLPFNQTQRSYFRSVLHQFQPDLVHSHSMVDVATGVWADVADAGYPIVHTLRDYDLLCANGAMYHHGRPCGPICGLVSAAKKRHHKAVRAVAAISQRTLDIHTNRGLFSHVPASLRRVIWNSAPVEGIAINYRRPSRSGPLSFGYLGRLSEEKGVGLLIQAVKRLPLTPDWRLVIAGNAGANVDVFRRAAQGMPIEFVGLVRPREFFECIDLLVVPSIWEEPFGRVVIEAYSMGVPVLGADIGGIPEIIVGDRDQWLFPVGDEHALAARLIQFVASGREALPSANVFSNRVADTAPAFIEARYRRLYQALLGPK